MTERSRSSIYDIMSDGENCSEVGPGDMSPAKRRRIQNMHNQRNRRKRLKLNNGITRDTDLDFKSNYLA
jgi:hypothetical protein